MTDSLSDQGPRGLRRFWKGALEWAVGSFIGIVIVRGFPPSREALEFWAIFTVSGTVMRAVIDYLKPRIGRLGQDVFRK